MPTTDKLPLQDYQCFKKVKAAKIEQVLSADADGRTLRFAADTDGNIPQIVVSADYAAKHRPVAGGYFVQYEGGYQSFSPADAFESGYDLIEDAKPDTSGQ